MRYYLYTLLITLSDKEILSLYSPDHTLWSGDIISIRPSVFILHNLLHYISWNILDIHLHFISLNISHNPLHYFSRNILHNLLHCNSRNILHNILHYISRNILHNLSHSNSRNILHNLSHCNSKNILHNILHCISRNTVISRIFILHFMEHCHLTNPYITFYGTLPHFITNGKSIRKYYLYVLFSIIIICSLHNFYITFAGLDGSVL